ncbi:hypothetical protein K504DRAFT_385688 [Pleomassaria siparia CBS 279.74]|uniref:DUF7905 domain-containing protein n=1 Tax=Pleomassaria siparia CBS 279.74 TaxID=1314801 RepID=A0A6G1K1V3_9PLEO|nr:hypothetical protein K504DRAFT_385688 [Pleomassaria siparia CBS 279.74]
MGENTGLTPDRKFTHTGKKPNRVITVPQDFGSRYNHRDLKRIISSWNISPDCEVVPYSQNGKLVRFGIFGAGSKLDETVRAVNKWIEHAMTKSTASSTWAKLPAFEHNKWYESMLREDENERKQKFKNPKPEEGEYIDQVFQVEVEWPQELLDGDLLITPRDAFGNKLERLDSIRTDCEVYITLLTNHPGYPKWQVEISGYDAEHILAGEEHYRNVVQKICTQKFRGDDKANITLDQNEGNIVVLEPAATWWPRKALKIVPRLLPAPMSDDPGTFRRTELHWSQFQMIEDHIRQSLEDVRYERGSYDFTIRYGCIALSKSENAEIKVGEQYAMEQFRMGINGKIGCHIAKWLFDQDQGVQLLARIMKSNQLLEPTKTSGGGLLGFTPSTLEQTRPTFRGTWVLHNPDSASAEDMRPFPRHPGRHTPNDSKGTAPKLAPPNLIVVQIDWTEDESGLFEKMSPMFYKLKPGISSPSERMDFNLLELGESKGWHFGLESMTNVPKSTLPPTITGFAEKVKMKPGCSINPSSTEAFAQWPSSPSYKLEMSRLDKIYTFDITKMGYQVEVLAMWYPRETVPSWGLRVRHKHWPIYLGVLEQLRPGRGVDFGDTVETFLPSNGVTSTDQQDKEVEDLGLQKLDIENNNSARIAPARDGIRKLVNKLMQLSDIINGSDAYASAESDDLSPPIVKNEK